MPFKSEKQRRFLWAEHPEIAKRWAHDYPESNKNLPMYADKKDDSPEKKAALEALTKALTSCGNSLNPLTNAALGSETKAATDGLMYVKLPHNDKPTYAGEERAETGEKQEETPNCSEDGKNHSSNSVEAVFGKLAVVLSKPLREAMEAQQALAEGRDPRFVPQNMALRRLALQSPTIPPPMGLTAPAPAPTPAPAVQQPGNSQQTSAVGGGSNPQHNPISAFGPLGAKGQLNGNAAFGVKNSPDSLKTAALAVLAKVAGEGGAWTRAEGKNPEGGLNAKGRASLKAQGHDIKAPVTESNPKGERAGRRKSFCSRMCGMKRVNTGAETKSDPDSRINKSLRKWNCKCSSAVAFGFELGEKLASQPTWGEFGHQLGQAVNPMSSVPKGTGTLSYMDKWYNPWTKNKDPLTPGEGLLRGIGQAGLATGVLAAPSALGAAATLESGSVAPAAWGMGSGILSNMSARSSARKINARQNTNQTQATQQPASAPTQQPARPPVQKPAPQQPASQQPSFGMKRADQHGGVFGPAGYVNTLSRWYNPWTTQHVTDPTEKAMMRVGQGALGLGAAAGVGAAGVAAAAPTLASTNLSALPAYFAGNTAAQAGAGAAGAGGAAAANPNTQQMFPTVNSAMQGVGTFANKAMGALQQGTNFYANKVAPTMDKLHYKPDAALSDAYAVARGDLKSVKGPGLLPTPSLPIGAPAFPKPMALAQNAIKGVGNMMAQ